MDNMTQPIEVWHTKFKNKFDCLKIILDECDSKEIKVQFYDLKNQFNILETSYMARYYMAADRKAQCEVMTELNMRINSSSLVSNISKLLIRLKQHAEESKWDSDKMFILRTQENLFRESKIKRVSQTININICPECKSPMTIYAQFSQLRCSKCPYNMTLYGTTFDDSQARITQDSVAKGGNYEISRHFNNHLDQILGKKFKVVTPAVNAKIKHWLELNGVEYPQTLKHTQWRQCLKKIKETSYNDSIPHIRELYSDGSNTGYLKYRERKRIEIIFEIIIDVYDMIKEQLQNIKYYPFFIAKLIVIELNAPEDRERKQYLLGNIHFQEEDTIEFNDIIWKKICDNVEILNGKYQVTDKHKIHRL